MLGLNPRSLVQRASPEHCVGSRPFLWRGCSGLEPVRTSQNSCLLQRFWACARGGIARRGPRAPFGATASHARGPAQGAGSRMHLARGPGPLNAAGSRAGHAQRFSAFPTHRARLDRFLSPSFLQEAAPRPPASRTPETWPCSLSASPPSAQNVREQSVWPTASWESAP